MSLPINDLDDTAPLTPRLVADLNATSFGSNPNGLVSSGGALYFVANNGTNGAELWRVDPSSGNVSQLEINPGSSGSSISDPIDVGGILYFNGYHPTLGYSLYRITSNTAQPERVELTQGSSSHAYEMINMNGTLVFRASNGGSGTELWQIKPGESPSVIDIRPGSSGSSPRQLFNANGQLFFTANDGSGSGTELWTLDLTVFSHQVIQ